MRDVVLSLSEAVEMISDGASLMMGGFLGVGSPHRIIAELVRQKRRHVTVIANDSARPGIGLLVDAKPVAKLGIDLVVTELAVIEPRDDGLLLKELAPGVGCDRVVAATGAKLGIPAFVPEMPIAANRDAQRMGRSAPTAA